jgi:hypothetical protein
LQVRRKRRGVENGPEEEIRNLYPDKQTGQSEALHHVLNEAGDFAALIQMMPCLLMKEAMNPE